MRFRNLTTGNIINVTDAKALELTKKSANYEPVKDEPKGKNGKEDPASGPED